MRKALDAELEAEAQKEAEKQQAREEARAAAEAPKTPLSRICSTSDGCCASAADICTGELILGLIDQKKCSWVSIAIVYAKKSRPRRRQRARPRLRQRGKPRLRSRCFRGFPTSRWKTRMRPQPRPRSVAFKKKMVHANIDLADLNPRVGSRIVSLHIASNSFRMLFLANVLSQLGKRETNKFDRFWS